MEIRNEIKGKDEKKQFVQRSLTDIQRAKLNKLMDKPDKPVIIPENVKRDKEYVPPSFIRNVMGSSAGAGSGEFHVYRHLRRKEYSRIKNMKVQTEKEILDQKFQEKLEENQRIADERTNKKREKRLKKKMKQKNQAKKPKMEKESENESSGNEQNSNDEEETENPTEAPQNVDKSDEKPEINDQSDEATENEEKSDSNEKC